MRARMGTASAAPWEHSTQRDMEYVAEVDVGEGNLISRTDTPKGEA